MCATGTASQRKRAWRRFPPRMSKTSCKQAQSRLKAADRFGLSGSLNRIQKTGAAAEQYGRHKADLAKRSRPNGCAWMLVQVGHEREVGDRDQPSADQVGGPPLAPQEVLVSILRHLYSSAFASLTTQAAR